MEKRLTEVSINPVALAREEQKKKAWIRNVVRCMGMTEEEAERHWDKINNPSGPYAMGPGH